MPVGPGQAHDPAPEHDAALVRLCEASTGHSDAELRRANLSLPVFCESSTHLHQHFLLPARMESLPKRWQSEAIVGLSVGLVSYHRSTTEWPKQGIKLDNRKAVNY